MDDELGNEILIRGKVMIDKINKLICLLRELEKFLLVGKIADGDSTKHIYLKINYAIKVLGEEIKDSSKSSEELRNVLLEFKNFYIGLFNTRVGLSSLFIWSDNFNERLKLNNELELLKNEIEKILDFAT